MIIHFLLHLIKAISHLLLINDVSNVINFLNVTFHNLKVICKQEVVNFLYMLQDFFNEDLMESLVIIVDEVKLLIL